MYSFVLKPWRCVAFLRASLSTTFFGVTTRSAVFLAAGRAEGVFLLVIILRVTFLPFVRLPFAREAPDDLALGAARRTAPRETREVLRLLPAVLFLLFFFNF